VIRSRKSIAGLLAVAAAALGVGQALGATETITTTPSCCSFSKTSFNIDPGQVAIYANAGDASHNVNASSNGPDGNVLFSSDTITSGQTAVNGTQYLTSGSYPFYCTVHPEMTAQLVVSGNGTPLARPSVQVSILSSKIDKVVSKGRLQLRVTAKALSPDVEIVAKKGARTLGTKPDLDVAAGFSGIAGLKLSKAGKNALRNLDSAKVKVIATVPFGSGDTASRKLK
jgi:plastocyanin